MKQRLAHIALAVRDCGEAIDFYSRKLNFDLIEDLYGNLRYPLEPAKSRD